MHSIQGVQINALNEGQAAGTDTSRAAININAEGVPIFGEFSLSITYLGKTKTTNCIEWDADEDVLESEIESLSNVDSVEVVRFGNGQLSNGRGGFVEKVDKVSFSVGNPSNVLHSADNLNLEGIVYEGDRIQFVGQSNLNEFYVVLHVNTSTTQL